MKPFKCRGRVVDENFPLRQDWIWCPACNRLAVRHLLRGPGFECGSCHALSIKAPRAEVHDGLRSVTRVIRRADNGYGFVHYRGRELRVRRQSDGSWRIVGR